MSVVGGEPAKVDGFASKISQKRDDDYEFAWECDSPRRFVIELTTYGRQTQSEEQTNKQK